jgi:hypothetical protein
MLTMIRRTVTVDNFLTVKTIEIYRYLLARPPNTGKNFVADI